MLMHNQSMWNKKTRPDISWACVIFFEGGTRESETSLPVFQHRRRPLQACRWYPSKRSPARSSLARNYVRWLWPRTLARTRSAVRVGGLAKDWGGTRIAFRRRRPREVAASHIGRALYRGRGLFFNRRGTGGPGRWFLLYRPGGVHVHARADSPRNHSLAHAVGTAGRPQTCWGRLEASCTWRTGASHWFGYPSWVASPR